MPGAYINLLLPLPEAPGSKKVTKTGRLVKALSSSIQSLPQVGQLTQLSLHSELDSRL